MQLLILSHGRREVNRIRPHGDFTRYGNMLTATEDHDTMLSA